MKPISETQKRNHSELTHIKNDPPTNKKIKDNQTIVTANINHQHCPLNINTNTFKQESSHQNYHKFDSKEYFDGLLTKCAHLHSSNDRNYIQSYSSPDRMSQHTQHKLKIPPQFIKKEIYFDQKFQEYQKKRETENPFEPYLEHSQYLKSIQRQKEIQSSFNHAEQKNIIENLMEKPTVEKEDKKLLRQVKQNVNEKIKVLKSNKVKNDESNGVFLTKGVEFIPVDFKFERKNEVKVYEVGKSFYSITLNQSNMIKDNNKFYIIQVLENRLNERQFYLFTRWGRVGVDGQCTTNGPVVKKDAIRMYQNKVQDKIKQGSYKIVQVSYEEENKQEMEIDQYFSVNAPSKESSLNEKVQELVKLIFDFKMMNNHMAEIGYDDKRSPLGLLAKSNIDRGYIALEKLLRVLRDNQTLTSTDKRKQLREFSGEFYSAIPHDFGYMNMQAFVLDKLDKVKQKLEMLGSLSQIQICSKLLKDNHFNPEINEIDVKYMKLRCKIEPLNKNTKIYSSIIQYMQNTHGKTHDKYNLQLLQIFSLSREEDEIKYRKDIGNKMLLWHGSRLTNYVGILSEGLKIAPYEAPVTGYMFGKGIYFADVVSKSANYCIPSRANSIGLMLLCEVALGEVNDKFKADYGAHNLPGNKQSTRGVGKNAPSSGEMVDGVWIPNGILGQSTIAETSLLYNEYVIYNKDQLRCRYIVKFKFNFK